MKNKDYSIKLFQLFLENIKLLNDTELDDLVKGNGKLVFIKDEKQVVKKQAKVGNEIDTYKEIIEKMNNREDAYKFLSDKKFTKAILSEIAKSCKVSVLKSDKREKLIEKIVEGVIGTKLKFKAIRQCNLESKKRISN